MTIQTTENNWVVSDMERANCSDLQERVHVRCIFLVWRQILWALAIYPTRPDHVTLPDLNTTVTSACYEVPVYSTCAQVARARMGWRLKFCLIYFGPKYETGVRGGAVGWGAVLQAGTSWVRLPMRSAGFFITYSFRPHYGPGVDSASNRTEYQRYLLGGKGGQCVGLTFLPSCADYLRDSVSPNLKF